MSSSPDPQTWVFPPLGAADLPSDVSAAFGPISQGDRIKLEWAPASSTPQIIFKCANVSESNQSPLIYDFTQTINNGSSHVCWLFFPGTFLGNTVTFEYNNKGSDSVSGSSVLWEQDSQLAEALSSKSVSVSTTTVTQFIAQTPSTILTTIANPSTTYTLASLVLPTQSSILPTAYAIPVTNASPGLSAGAAAGITAVVMILLDLLLLFGWCTHCHINKRSTIDNAEDKISASPGLIEVSSISDPMQWRTIHEIGE